MPEVTCAVVDDLLDLYLDGETNEETAKVLEGHLSGCARCRSRLEQRRRARVRLARLAWGNREVSDLLGADARVIAAARRRLRRVVFRAVAIVIAAAVAGWAGIWFFSAPAPPGLYLARFTASQIVVDGRTGLHIPFLWVPEYPGQRPPELWTVEIPCSGRPGLTLKVAAVTLEGPTYGPLRYQQGWIYAYQQEGVYTDLGHGSASFHPNEPPLEPLWDEGSLPYVAHKARGMTVVTRSGQVLASSTDIDLTLVQWNDRSIPVYRPAPDAHGAWTPVAGVGSGAGGCFVYLDPDVEGMELVDVVLPDSFGPLWVEVSGDPNPPGKAQPLELPWEMPTGWIRVLGGGEAGPGCVVLNPLVVFRVAGETYREEAGQYMSLSPDAPLEELYDLGQPD